jgi:hypothetical protein
MLVVVAINIDALFEFWGRVSCVVFAEMDHKKIRVLSFQV